MLENITVETSKGNKKKNQRQNDKKKDKYAQIKRFHYERWLQVYMYDFMYVDPEKMKEDEYYHTQIYLLETTRRYQLQDQSPKVCLEFFTYVQKIMR